MVGTGEMAHGDRIKRHWWSACTLPGLTALMSGVLVLFFPGITATMLVMITGILLALIGVLIILSARRRSTGLGRLPLLAGSIGFITGFAAILWTAIVPAFSVGTVAIITLITGALIGTMAAFGKGIPHRELLSLPGLISILSGLLFLQYPFLPSVLPFRILAGAYLVTWGVTALFFSFEIRSIRRRQAKWETPADQLFPGHVDQDRSGPPQYAMDILLRWRYGNVFCYTLQVLLLAIALTGIWIGDDYRATWGFVALFITFLPLIVEWRMRISFPWPMKFFLALALLIHMSGGIMRWYFTLYPVYDKLAHFISAITISFMLFMLILVIGLNTRFHPGPWIVAFLILVTSFFLGEAWEYAELTIDVVYSSTYFVNPLDSIFDTTFNLIGCGYIALLAYTYLKREPLEKVHYRFIHDRP
jgi:uncharacterized membrane protein HdeD (DUF308 family)